MSRGNSLAVIPSPAGSSGRSLFRHSQEALDFTCFFCLSVIPFIAASHINDATAQGIRRWKQIEPGFLWDCFSIWEQRCYVFSLCSSALVNFQAFNLALPFGGNAVVMIEASEFEDGLQANICVPTAWDSLPTKVLHCFKLIHWPEVWIAAQIAGFGVGRHIPVLPVDGGKISVFLLLCWLPYTCQNRASDIG